jgi:hypothetical protein
VADADLREAPVSYGLSYHSSYNPMQDQRIFEEKKEEANTKEKKEK